MPWIVSLPFRLEPGVVVETTVQNVDIWPTLLDLLGVPALPETDGRSRLPLIEAALQGPAGTPPARDESAVCLRPARPALGLHGGPVPDHRRRHGGPLSPDRDQEPGARTTQVELFDHRADPAEANRHRRRPARDPRPPREAGRPLSRPPSPPLGRPPRGRGLRPRARTAPGPRLRRSLSPANGERCGARSRVGGPRSLARALRRGAARPPVVSAPLAGRGRDRRLRAPGARVRLPEGPRPPQCRLSVRVRRGSRRRRANRRLHRDDMGALLLRRSRRRPGEPHRGPSREDGADASSLRARRRRGRARRPRRAASRGSQQGSAPRSRQRPSAARQRLRRAAAPSARGSLLRPRHAARLVALRPARLALRLLPHRLARLGAVGGAPPLPALPDLLRRDSSSSRRR